MLVKSIHFCRSQASYRGAVFRTFGLLPLTIVAPKLRGLLLAARFILSPGVSTTGPRTWLKTLLFTNPFRSRGHCRPVAVSGRCVESSVRLDLGSDIGKCS